MATAQYSFQFPTQLKRLVNPTDPQDAATKSYVDAQATPPGGSNTQIQFNDNGVFGGSSQLTFDSANAANGMTVISSFTANPGAHIIQVQGLSATIGSVADGGVTVANATTTINTPSTSITSPITSIGDSSSPGGSYLTVDVNGVSLGQAGGQVISAGSSGISIGGTGGVQIQGVANSTVTLGGSTSGNINFVTPTNLGPIANVHIDGGSSGDYLQTDGAGTLSWTPGPATTLVVIGRTGQINVPVVNRILTVGGRSGNISVFVN